MSSSHPSHSPIAEEQAALWAAKIDGASLSGSDHAELETWLAAHPAHRALLSQYCQFSADLEEQVPALVAAGMVAMPEVKQRRPRFAWFAGLSMAAAAAVAVGLYVAKPQAARAQTYATVAAHRQSLTLADGTRMELNANTSVQILNLAHERRVLLASGEAFFTVSKDRSRPFIVTTPAGSVRVTGTVFNVRSEAKAQLEVTVVEGSVDVRPDAANVSTPIALLAGGRVSAEGTHVAQSTLSASAVDDAVAWRHGQAVFGAGVALEEAVARFARYHGRAVKAVGPAAKLLMGGTYPLDDLDGFLDDVVRVHHSRGLTFEKDSSGAVVFSLPAKG
ncbi:MAG TPA: FecR domain-containing protein [Opitutaceae bacterium]|nr:FecR domain-containing protein [Opitutaceae bacterium]